MSSNLKSFKVLQISADGCIYTDHSVYLKTYKKYRFSKKSLFSNLLKKKEFTLTNSNFFYKKYRNQIIKKLINEFTINCKKYSKFI
jgi:UDP-N-acetylmuramyl tripeptide synthase